MFVNNPELWNSFTEEVEENIASCHKKLEQHESQAELYRIQGEVRALRRLLQLRDKINGSN